MCFWKSLAVLMCVFALHLTFSLALTKKMDSRGGIENHRLS